MAVCYQMKLAIGPTRHADKARLHPAAGYLTHLMKFRSDRQVLERGVVESAGCSTTIHPYTSLFALQYTHAAFGERIRLPHLPATRTLTYRPQTWLPK